MKRQRMAALFGATALVLLCAGVMAGCDDYEPQDFVSVTMTQVGGGTLTIPHGPLKGTYLQVNPGNLAADAIVSVRDASPVGASLAGYTNTGPVADLSVKSANGSSVAFVNGIFRIPYTTLGANPVVLRRNGMLVTVNPSSTFAGGYATTLASVEGQYWVANTNPAVSAVSVESLSVSSGPDGGGTLVMVNGSGFMPHPGVTLVVTFGGNAAVAISPVNDTQFVCRSPAGSGTVAVTVTVMDGDAQLGTNTLAAAFTYQPSE